MEVKSKALFQKIDLKTTHEEEDVILPQQVVALADTGFNIINIICDDAYVFCTTLPLLSVSLIMEPTSRSRSSIAIGATVAKHSGIVSQLIAAHAISGCDKVGCYLKLVSERQVIKALSAGIELNHLGDPKASLDDAMKESTHLMVLVMDRVRSTRHNVFSPLQGTGITHWAKGGQYLPEAKISSAYYGSL